MKQDRTTLLHLQLVSKSQFCPQKNQKIALTFGRVAKTPQQPGEATFLLADAFLKKGTSPL
jgi:hypothetical protein